MRVDKYLWSVRLFKTRSKASEACRTGKVKVNGSNIRPAKNIAVGDKFTVRKGPVLYQYKVKELLKSRVGAKLVEDYLIDETSPEELEKLKILRSSYTSVRAKGLGRPTKKDRREIDDFAVDGIPDEENDDWDEWLEWLNSQEES